MRFLRAIARRLRKLCRTPRRFRSWSTISKAVLAGYIFMINLNSVYGYFPARFSFKNEKFLFCRPLAVYSFAMAAIFGVFVVKPIWEEYSSGQIDQRNAIQIYCYMNACGVLLYYLYHWVICQKVVDMLNTMTIFKVINDFDIAVISLFRAMALVLVRIFGFPILMQFTLVFYQRQKHPELSWTSTCQTMFPIISANQLNNCYFCSVVIAREIYTKTNKLLAEVFCEVNRLQIPSEMLLHKPFYRMQRFCDLADRLDQLGTRYVFLNIYCQHHLKFGCFSVVVSLAINLFSITLGCYVQYQTFVDYLMLDKPYDIGQALAQFVFLALSFLEIVLLAKETQQLIVEAREAGYLLQRINLEHADIRFKQEVDAFWLKVQLTQFKIMPLGLLELDGSLVNTMYTTVAGFLLFLIQNDLTVRFSLK